MDHLPTHFAKIGLISMVDRVFIILLEGHYETYSAHNPERATKAGT
jgi:hypothetical protein